MQYKDYYKILGVDRNATQDAIKKAYRRLARKYHPDVSQEENAEKQFKEVSEAYEVLGDPEKRSAYNRFGSQWKEGQDFHPPPGWEGGFGRSASGFRAEGQSNSGDFSDFFESLFGQMGGGGAGRRTWTFSGDAFGGEAFSRAAREPAEEQATIRLDLEDSYYGGNRTVSVTTPAAAASGSSGSRTLNVRIPRGVTEGQQIRLARQGSAGRDLYLKVAFEPHPLFSVEGRDLTLDLPVAPWEAARGDKVAIPTLAGDVNLRLPEGAQSGQRLRLKGRGLPGNPAGDQYVRIKIVTPPANTPKRRELYARMAEEMGFDPRADFNPTRRAAGES